jgi:hypothetical protein
VSTKSEWKERDATDNNEYRSSWRAGVGGVLLFHRLAHPLRDRGWIIVHRKRHAALESLRACDQYAEAALEWVGGDPRLMRARRVPAASDHGRFNALAAGAGDDLDVEEGDCMVLGNSILETLHLFLSATSVGAPPGRRSRGSNMFLATQSWRHQSSRSELYGFHGFGRYLHR